MGDVVWDYKYIVMVAAVVSVYYIYEWQRAKTILYSLMLQAERQSKDLTMKPGKEQEDWVVKKAGKYLPAPVRLFLNENVLTAVVHELYRSSKKYQDIGS